MNQKQDTIVYVMDEIPNDICTSELVINKIGNQTSVSGTLAACVEFVKQLPKDMKWYVDSSVHKKVMELFNGFATIESNKNIHKSKTTDEVLEFKYNADLGKIEIAKIQKQHLEKKLEYTSVSYLPAHEKYEKMQKVKKLLEEI